MQMHCVIMKYVLEYLITSWYLLLALLCDLRQWYPNNINSARQATYHNISHFIVEHDLFVFRGLSWIVAGESWVQGDFASNLESLYFSTQVDGIPGCREAMGRISQIFSFAKDDRFEFVVYEDSGIWHNKLRLEKRTTNPENWWNH